MITKQLFKKCMDAYIKFDKWDSKLSQLGVNIWECEEVANLKSTMLDLLSYCCKDNGVDNIGYFLYEVDCGEKADEYFITEADGTEIKFHTVDDLWNHLVKCNDDIVDTNVVEDEEKTEISQEELGKIFSQFWA